MDELSKCVEALKEVRRSLHDGTDPIIGVALDKVIAGFEGCMCNANIASESELSAMVKEALEILSYILSCCASAAELVCRFHA